MRKEKKLLLSLKPMVYGSNDNCKQRSLSIWPSLMRVMNECETGLL